MIVDVLSRSRVVEVRVDCDEDRGWSMRIGVEDAWYGVSVSGGDHGLDVLVEQVRGEAATLDDREGEEVCFCWM